ncbi:MAG: hypothetical protein QX197_02565 [Methylococcaceae bacterium]
MKIKIRMKRSLISLAIAHSVLMVSPVDAASYVAPNSPATATMVFNNVEVNATQHLAAFLSALDNLALHNGQVYQLMSSSEVVNPAIVQDALYSEIDGKLYVPYLVQDGGTTYNATLLLTNSSPIQFTVINTITTSLTSAGEVVFTEGPPGPAGPAGADGKDGATGPAGADGKQGLPGTNGADGAVGAVGPAGANGADGAVGSVGPKGADGAAGPAGPKGDTGAVGLQGAAGTNGIDGAAGPAGPAGAKGDTGAVGPQGPVGEVGAQGSAGSQGPAGEAGPVGPVGPQGPQGPQGSQGPAGMNWFDQFLPH